MGVCSALRLVIWAVVLLGSVYAEEVALSRSKRDAEQGTCPSGQTYVKSSIRYLDTGYQDHKPCSSLISQLPDRVDPYLLGQCQRWVGGSTPEHIGSAYVAECYTFSNDTVKYRTNICCLGEPSGQRCVRATNATNDYIADYHYDVITCSAGEVCQSQYECDNVRSYPLVTKGCVASGSCSSLTTTCPTYTRGVDTCEQCCSGTPFCNQRTDSTVMRCSITTTNTCDPACTSGNGYCGSQNTCSCYTGCHGPTCDTCYPGCSPNPCQNGGRCSRHSTGYTCCCAVGYEGTNCETDIAGKTCGTNPCGNGGTCYKYTNGTRCLCADGYIGNTCQYENTLPCNGSRNYFHTLDIYGYFYGYSSSSTCDVMAATRFSLGNFLSNCKYYMQSEYGLSERFVDGKHGQVDENQAFSYGTCLRTERCTRYDYQMCCATCFSLPCQNGGYCTQVANGDYNCKCRYGFSGRNCENVVSTCLIFGEPHYKTFDGKHITNQGACKYALAVPSSENVVTDYFKVLTRNEHRGGVTHVSYTKYLEVEICGYTVRLGRNKVVTVKTGNGPFQAVQPVATYPCFTIKYSGRFVRLQAKFGLLVQFDGSYVASVQVPDEYAGKLGGICNDNDGTAGTDDLIGCDGVQYADDPAGHAEYGDSCLVPDDDNLDANCTSPQPPACPSDKVTKYSTRAWCGYIADITGPFSQCVADPRVYHAAFFESCLYDVCISEDNKCPDLEAFIDLCSSMGLIPKSDWRVTTSCELPCPDYAHYESSSDACQPTCEDPDAPSKCQEQNIETCVCDTDYIMKGDKCVLPEDCGCKHNNVLYDLGDVWDAKLEADGTCSQKACVNCTTCTVTVGMVIEEKDVTSSAHAVHGGWTTFSDWSECTSGSQKRSRTCTNPAPSCGGDSCAGNAEETRTCSGDATGPTCSANYNVEEECRKCDLTRNPTRYVLDPCDCHYFYQCQWDGLLGKFRYNRRPTPPCTCWDQSKLGLVRDPSASCTSTSGSNTVVAGATSCSSTYNGATVQYKVVPGDRTKYRWYISSGVFVDRDCPPGTLFDTQTCSCIHGANNSGNQKKPFTCLTFDNSNNPFYAEGLWVDPKGVSIVPGGRQQNAASCFGSSNIEIPGFSNKQNQRLSVSLFYKRQGSDTGLQVLVSNDNCQTASPASVQIRSESQTTVGGGIRTTQTDLLDAFTNVQVSAGAWHHVVMTYDGSALIFYVDNVLIGTRSITGMTAINPCPLLLCSMYGRAYFTGLIDQFCIYDYALSVSQVANLYTNPGNVILP